jgi:1,2-diacylglycerol 3-alpha-glucosyltransferase
MNVGIVSWWFNRGQATVARHLRSACDELGYSTSVMARPNRAKVEIRPGLVASDDVWDQSGVTVASHFKVPLDEYVRWIEENSLDVVLFDQNYQFERIRQLRERGVRTIGRFVWEQFALQHAEPARSAYDVIYSLTACEQARYRRLGIESPRVRWGCHPELLRRAEPPKDDGITRFFYPGGYLTRRKPTGAVVRAFSEVERDDVRLILKSQYPLRRSDLLGWAPRRRKLLRGWERGWLRSTGALDARIEVRTEDIPFSDYHALLSSCDVLLAPSRWEGLGLHLFEAAALGMPVVTNDAPPMTELVEDGRNGLLVRSREVAQTDSGIPVWEPDVRAMTAAIEQMADPATRKRLGHGALEQRAELDWSRTVQDVELLLSA